MKGRSTLAAALSMPFALLASTGIDEAACLDIRQDSRVKTEAGWARLFRKTGVRPSSA
jgi:predicted methyltransferase MtxX (methanogen marker protein 4)